MNFDFSSEQKQFASQVRRLLETVSPLSEARSALDGEIAFSDPAWRGLADLGFAAIAIPEAYGGLGLGPLELCVAAEEIGRALAPVPALSSVYLCAEAIRLFGTAAQQDRWLPRLSDGSCIGTWAASEGPTELAEAHIQTRIEAGRLNGSKAPVLDGLTAQVAVVLARDRLGKVVLTVCDLGSDLIDRQGVRNVDPSRPVASLTFNGARAEPLGAAGWSEWEHLQHRAAVFLAFEQIGAADRALWMARDYALERKSFGRPIGSYQAIKHKLANVYAKNQVARSHAYYGAWALASDAPELPLAAAGARAAAIDAFSFAAQENLQTHGGVGYTWDHDCQLFYRRARQQALILGSAAVWRRRILSQLRCANRA